MDWTRYLSARTRRVQFSGIRKFFEIASRMQDPCDLSIGLPDYDAPEQTKRAAIDAIVAGRNRYTPTAGIPDLVARLASDLTGAYGVAPAVLVTSGVSGALTLVLLATIDEGDEVVFADPYFVSYLQLVRLAGGTPVPVSTYPKLRFAAAAVEAAVTPRTKILMINSPTNPTGLVMTETEVRAAVDIARRHDLLLVSDEIYEGLCYDGPNACPMPMAPERTVILRGLGKSHGVTGWRLGYAAGPAELVHEMTKLQQFTYVCAPSMAQCAMLASLDVDVSHHRREYARKRDLVCELLSPRLQFERPSGGFYVFPRVPAGYAGGSAFAEAAAAERVLVIPGSVFSERDTHFRVSYAATDETLRRGCEVLCRLARR